jgi:hypothetical protein
MANPIASLRQIGRIVRVPVASFTCLPKGTRRFGTTSTLFTESGHKNIDRTELKPDRDEYSKSGTDNEVAGHSSAFEPSMTTPESELKASCQESRRQGKISNPLKYSPGNKEISQDRDPGEGGPDESATHTPSARVTPPKNRPVNKPH